MPDLKEKLEDRAAGEVANRAPTVTDLIERQKGQIARALPKHLNHERFARIVLTECRRNPELLRCTPASLLGAVMTAAQLGLEPGPLQHCYLIPRKNHGVHEVTLLIGYRGFIDLARRGGQTLSIDAQVVHEADEFEFSYGLDPTLHHVPARTDRGEPRWVYAVAKFRDGGHSFVVLSMGDVDARRERSAAGSKGPWQTDFDAMCRKTAVRALAPYLPQSIELAQAERLDGGVRSDLGVDLLEFNPPDDVLDVEGEEVVGGPGAGDAAPSEANGGDPLSPSVEAEPAPGPDDATAEAFRLVTERRAVKASGAARNHRELDEFLNELGLDMELAQLDAERAPAVIAWLVEHPVGAK